MRKITATRYVTPLREGGSLPAIIEADDDGLYVLKFRGAGQGTKALIAELVTGEIARAAGLLVPEIVFVELDAVLARTEPDTEIRELIQKSAGLNIALDYLPGSVMFNPAADIVDKQYASSVVWLDAYTSNVDRSARNTNMLVWHKKLYLIDHGASLYFHHKWDNYLERSIDPFPFIKDHVLLNDAVYLKEADEEITRKISEKIINNIIEKIPDDWLADDPAFENAEQFKDAYKNYLIKRLKSPHYFLEEAIRARS